MDLDFHVRYFMEHKALPSNLYTEGTRLLSRFMISGGKAMLDYYTKAEESTPFECNYNTEDFTL